MPGNPVEPPDVTTSRKRLPLLNDQVSEIRKVSKSNHDISSLFYATTSRKRPRPLLELKGMKVSSFFMTSPKIPFDRVEIGLSGVRRILGGLSEANHEILNK